MGVSSKLGDSGFSTKPHTRESAVETMAPPAPVHTMPPEPMESHQHRLGVYGFIGREREMGVLRAGLDAVLDGSGRVILLGGDAGIGKTRTQEEIAAAAGARGARVLWGRCYEGEGAPAFWPWTQILRSLVRDLGVEAIRRALGTAVADLNHLIPDLGDAADPPLPPSLDAAAARFRLYDAVTQCIQLAAHDRPTVLLVDDLHGADPSSLQLLLFVARMLRDERVLIVAGHRVAHPDTGRSFAKTLAELLRVPWAQQLALAGLSVAEVGRFVQNVSRTESAFELSREIHRRTEGNPLFVSEFVRFMLASGTPFDSVPGSLPVPQSLQAIIGSRLDPLSPACGRILFIAATIGREFPLAVIEAVADDEPNDLDEIGECLDEAVAAALIEPMPIQPRTYRFTHALVREILYEGGRARERERLHRRVGEALERLSGRDKLLAEIAYHHFAAGGETSSDKAVRYARAAGDRARELHAHEEAERLYQLALDALDRQAGGDEAQRCDLLVALGWAQNACGKIKRARETFLRAADLARALGAREPFGRAALGYGGELTTGVPSDEIQVALLHESLERWGNNEDELAARLISKLALALPPDGHEEFKDALARKALMVARKAVDPRALVYALHAFHLECWAWSPVTERLAVSTELATVARVVGDRWMTFVGMKLRMLNLVEMGDRAAMDREIDLCTAMDARQNQPVFGYELRLMKAVRPIIEGRFAEAERLAAEAAEFGGQPHVRRDVPFAAVAIPAVFSFQMFVIRRALGELELQRSLFEQALDRLRDAWPVRCMLASIYYQIGLLPEAQRQVDLLAARDFVDFILHNNGLPAATLLAEVCVGLRDVRRAELLFEILSPHHSAIAAFPSTIYVDPVAYALGGLAQLLGRVDQAASHFETAIRLNAAMRARPSLARTQCAYASLLLERARQGDRERAEDLLTDAIAASTDLGMKGVLATARALAERAVDGVRSKTIPAATAVPDRRPEAASRTGMFRREGDYWTIELGGSTVRLRNSRGLEYLALLLRHPGRDFHVLDLSVGTVEPRSARERQNRRADAILDPRARAEYRRRLDELREDIAQAEEFNDLGRLERLRQEMGAVQEQLAAATGMRGHDRLLPSDAERARQAVTHRIRSALRKIGHASAPLETHLTACIVTGYFCLYRPELDTPVDWSF